MLERIIPFAHSKIKEYITKDDIVVDMTVGNGHDTVFLAPLCKHVYAFDIQEDAIQNTLKLLSEKEISNVSVVLDSHEHVDQYVSDPIRCAVYNLGYLPKGNHSITTEASSTLASLKVLLPMMARKSIISITVYIGHEQGLFESTLLQEFVSTLSSKEYNVLLYSNLNKHNAPYNIFIEKIGE